MIFEHNVKGKFPFEKFEIDLRNHAFIKDLEILPFTSKPLYAKFLNSAMALKAYLGSIFPSIFQQKLTEISLAEKETLSDQYKKLLSECKVTSTKDEKPVIMVNIMRKNRSNNDNDIYSKQVMTNIFPLIKSRIYMAGEPESEYWDMIGLVRYQSTTKLCEMLHSEEYNRIKHLKHNGLDDSYTSLTATVLAYQKDLLE